MSIQMIALVAPTPGAEEQQNNYTSAAVPMLVGAGGEVRTRFKATGNLVGDTGPKMMLVMDFPDDRLDDLRAVFASDDYAALVPDRDAGFSRFDVIITEEV